MASGSQNLTTYYAKRIVGDTAASTPETALIQLGDGITADQWILGNNARKEQSGSPRYGIFYNYDSSGTGDKLELYGDTTNNTNVTAWVRLDTGDLYILGKVGIGYDPNTSGNGYKLYVDGTTYFNGDIKIKGHILTDANRSYNIGEDEHMWNNAHIRGIAVRHIDAATQSYITDGELHIGYGSVAPTKAIYLYYSADTSSRTKFFAVNSNGSYALTRFGVNGQSTSYNLYINGTTYTNNQVYINYAQDVGLNQNGSLVIGNKSGTNIGIDDNEIMARNNSAASTLYINSDGGQVYTTWLHIQNDSSNNSDDATVLISCQTANDWGLKINKGGQDYGLRVDSLDQGNAIWTNGYINCRILRANQGSNGERQVIVDSSTSGNLYMFANTSEKGLYSSSGYKTGYVIQITSSGKYFHPNQILMDTSISSAATSQPTALSYGRLQSYGNLCLNADTDGSTTEYCIITSGRGCSSTTSDGLWVGYSSAGLFGQVSYSTNQWMTGNAGEIYWAGNFHLNSRNGYHLYLNYHSPSYNIYFGNAGYAIYNNGANYNGNAANSDTVDGYHHTAFAKIAAHNDLTASGNEFTFAKSGHSGGLWINYRTAGGTNGNITEYIFGNGATGSFPQITCGTVSAQNIWANRGSSEHTVGVDYSTSGTLYLWSNGSNKGLYSSTGYKTGSVIVLDSGGSTIYMNNWFRCEGASGIYWQSYGGGLWMVDTTWIRTYNNKSFYCDAEIQATTIRSNTTLHVHGTTYTDMELHGNSTGNLWRIRADESELVLRFMFNAHTRGRVLSNGGFADGSSRLIKNTILPLKDMGTIIDKLEPCSFYLNDDRTHHLKFGLIYEDTLPILPEICYGTGPNPEDKSICYTNLVPVLLKEIQSLRKRVKDLENK